MLGICGIQDHFLIEKKNDHLNLPRLDILFVQDHYVKVLRE